MPRRTTAMPPGPKRRSIAAAADALSIVLFAAVGRRNHDEGGGLDAVLSTAAPFLVALAVGWLVVSVLAPSRPRFRDQVGVDSGVVIWTVTVVGGLLLRRTLWDRGTAVAFVIVTAAFLGAAIVGWRVVSRRVGRTPANA